VVLVDLVRRVASQLDDDASVERTICVDVRSGTDVAVSGSPDGRTVYAADSTRGVLLISTFGEGDCPRAVSLGSGTHQLGAPVAVGRRVLVPDYTSGHVHVVDTRNDSVVGSPAVLPGGGAFELFPRDGLAFYNDPASERAGVVKIDGSFRPIAKFTPLAQPGAGVTVATKSSAPVTVRPDATGLPAGAGPGRGPGSGGSNSDDDAAGQVLPPVAAPPRGTAGLQITASVPPHVAGKLMSFTVAPADGKGTLTGPRWTFGDDGG